MAVLIAKAWGICVIVPGNTRAKERFLAPGANQYLDDKKENSRETLSSVNHMIDALDAGELRHKLSVLKPGGQGRAAGNTS